MKKLIIICLIFVPFLLSANNVTTFGAQGDGKTLDTNAIQKAIDQVAAKGGGEIYFPPGTYLTGTIFLKDNITLNLSKGATILGSTDLKDYPVTPAKYISHINRYTDRYLIFAEGKKNITLKGEGVIDGQGGHPNFKANTDEVLLDIKQRPYVLRLVSCNRVVVSGLSMKDSPAWMQHYLDCTDVWIENLHIINHVNYNNDGIDIDNCRNVQIRNCNIDCDDDGICFKTTNSAGKCENIVVSNCLIASNCNAIKFGTETNGGYTNVAISNCVFTRSAYPTIYDRPYRALGGVALEVVDGAVMDGITVNNISMNGVMTPIFIRLANRGRNFYDGGPSQSVGSIRNITLSNITARMEGIIPSSITAVEGAYVENVHLDNIRIITIGGGSMDDAQRRNIPEMIKDYPETLMFEGVPAYGLFVKHVKGLTMNNIHFEAEKADNRSAIYCEDVQSMSLNNYVLSNPNPDAALITLNNVQNARFTNNLSVYKSNNPIRKEGNTKDIQCGGINK